MALLEIGLNPLESGRVVKSWHSTSKDFNLRLNPLESGRVVKLEKMIYSSSLKVSLNPLESGRVVK